MLFRSQASARQSFLLIVERLLELLDRERGLIASSADFAVLTDDLLSEFLEPFAVLLRHAQEAHEIRADLQPYDIPRVLSILVVGLSAPPSSPADRRRYVSLVFDAMGPDQGEPLPPLEERDGVDASDCSTRIIPRAMRAPWRTKSTLSLVIGSKMSTASYIEV